MAIEDCSKNNNLYLNSTFTACYVASVCSAKTDFLVGRIKREGYARIKVQIL